MRILYQVPDYDTPSWGVAMLYHHVRLLRGSGVEAAVATTGPSRPPAWLDVEVPVVHLEEAARGAHAADVLVVPEVLLDDPGHAAWPGRKLLFVQGSFILLRHLEAALTAQRRGFTAAIAVLPHVVEVVEAVCGLETRLVPPFVAPYFRAAGGWSQRRRQVVIHAKPEIPDYPVALDLLRRAVAGEVPGLPRPEPGWRVLELRGLSHVEAAELLRSSALFLNLNCWEAFNTTVPEAMAAGAVVVCYEAYGGRDYLRDGENAFVFPNNHLFPLVRRALELMCGAEPPERLEAIRRAAAATAAAYDEEATRAGLLAMVAHLAS